MKDIINRLSGMSLQLEDGSFLVLGQKQLERAIFVLMSPPESSSHEQQKPLD